MPFLASHPKRQSMKSKEPIASLLANIIRMLAKSLMLKIDLKKLMKLGKCCKMSKNARNMIKFAQVVGNNIPNKERKANAHTINIKKVISHPINLPILVNFSNLFLVG